MTAVLDTDYRMFRVTFYAVKDATDGTVSLRLNADSGANYAYQDITADSTTVDGARVTGATAIVLDTDGLVDGSSAALFTVEVNKPLTTTPARTTSTASYMQATGPAINYEAVVGEWANTADLIDEITVLASAGSFAIGTRCVIEGAQP
jgi:hypothetical protein